MAFNIIIIIAMSSYIWGPVQCLVFASGHAGFKEVLVLFQSENFIENFNRALAATFTPAPAHESEEYQILI